MVATTSRKLELARFEILACLEHEHPTDKQPRLVDDAFARQDVGNVAHARTARDIDDAILLQRARRLEALLTDDKCHARHNGQQHESADNGIADNDQRVPRAGRAACGKIDSVRFDGGARAARHALRIAGF
jgi:hypothetical protein